MKPYYAIVQLILRLKQKFITFSEYSIFAIFTKNNKDAEIEKIANLIELYREYNNNEIINNYIEKKEKKRKGKKRSTFKSVKEYAQKSIKAFLENSGDLFKREEGLKGREYIYKLSNETRATKFVDSFKVSQNKFHYYRNEYEYVKAIGNISPNFDEILKRNYFPSNPIINQKNVEEYYIDTDISEKNKVNLLELELQNHFEIEENLNKFLAPHFTNLYQLKILDDKRYNEERKTREYHTNEIGAMDILCQDEVTKNYYVIEIKRDVADGPAMGQLIQYMGWVENEFLEDTDTDSCYGVLICSKTSMQSRAATDWLKKYVDDFDERITVLPHKFNSSNRPTKPKTI